MHKYAQIDLESGVCISVSYLYSSVDAPHMIPLTSEDVQPGDIWDGQTWTRPDPPPSEPDPITQLQLAVAELAEAQEQTVTDIQLALAELAEMIAGGGN